MQACICTVIFMGLNVRIHAGSHTLAKTACLVYEVSGVGVNGNFIIIAPYRLLTRLPRARARCHGHCRQTGWRCSSKRSLAKDTTTAVINSPGQVSEPPPNIPGPVSAGSDATHNIMANSSAENRADTPDHDKKMATPIQFFIRKKRRSVSTAAVAAAQLKPITCVTHKSEGSYYKHACLPLSIFSDDPRPGWRQAGQTAVD